MCGRYALTLPPDAVRAFFRYVEQPNFPARTNIAPTQPVGIVRHERDSSGQGARHFTLVRWGFLPGFVKDPKQFPLVINARSETIVEKPSFRNAATRRRCIFVADAFYEWRRSATRRGRGDPPPQPFLFRRADGNPMALAGLWETWSGPNGEEVDTACILTTSANGPMSAIHDRMPVILEPETFDTWLDTDTHDLKEAGRLLQPAADEVLEFFEIGPGINKVANDSLELQAPAGPVERPPPRKPMPRRQADLFE
jgi:putative SOS response-associated peptidase YedK